MLRPATPLSVLLSAAFILLLVSVISIPVTQFVVLAEFKNVKYGVFGYCDGDKCTKIGLGYPEEGILNDSSQTFDLPASVRKSLSAVLVMHPVAAFLTLVLFGLAVGAHLHSASHSSRYLLVLFIFTLITFVICLVGFVVDVLLFIPHLSWGSYLVLTATIILAISCVVTFAMRRTIVGRKARQKRIAENAEMSGENFYNREGQVKPAPTFSSQPSVPMVSGGNTTVTDSLPAFATFESGRKDDQVSDERIPLTQRSPIERSPNAVTNDLNAVGDASSLAASRRSPSQDRYGSPVNGYPDAYGMQNSPYGRGRGGGYRGGRGGPHGRGGFDAYGMGNRGRGGYGPQPGRGGPRGRGGYGPPPRGAYGPGGMRGGRGPPPNGYGNMPPGQYYDRQPSTDEYSQYGQPQPSETSLNRGYGDFSAAANNDLPRAESPPPLPGQVSAGPHAIEMDGTGLAPPFAHGQQNQLRDSDVDVAGMVGLQQGHPMPGRDTLMSQGSKYSSDEHYVPPRAAWNQDSGRHSPRAASPAHSQNMPPAKPPSRSEYYEDTDPRFDAQQQSAHMHGQLPPSTEVVYEDVRATAGGARSPAESERSNFTSISQRGVNPRWEPQPPMPGQAPPQRRPVQQRQDVLLNNNPDFQLPGTRGQGGGRRGPGMIPGSAYPTGAM